MSNIFGRQVVVPLTNKSGGGVVAGDVVIVDTANNDSFTTTTSSASILAIGIVQETIANNATGRVLVGGYAALVNVNASVTRGNFGTTHTVAKQATDAGSARISGTFMRFLKSGTTPSAWIYPVDLAGAALTDPTTTRGDLIARGAAALQRLAVGGARKLLRSDGTDPSWGYLPYVGAKARRTTTQNVNNTSAFLSFDAEDSDSDGFFAPTDTKFTVPSGMDGKYELKGGAAIDAAGGDWLGFYKDPAGSPVQITSFGAFDAARASYCQVFAEIALVAGDTVGLKAATTANCNVGSAANHGMAWMSIRLMGT